MAKTRKVRRSRFEGINLDSLNEEAAKVTNKEIEVKEEKVDTQVKQEEIPVTENLLPSKKVIEIVEKKTIVNVIKRGKGRPKTSNRKPLNTAIEPKNKQRLEFLAMLNGGSVADQLNNILQKYFTEIERVDELIEIFEERKRKR